MHLEQRYECFITPENFNVLLSWLMDVCMLHNEFICEGCHHPKVQRSENKSRDRTCRDNE